MKTWTVEELILACYELDNNGLRPLRAKDVRAIALSGLLRSLPMNLVESARDPRFRSPNSVQRKMYDLRTQMDDYELKPTHGGGRDRAILHDYMHYRSMHRRIAEAVHNVFDSQLGRGSSHEWDN